MATKGFENAGGNSLDGAIAWILLLGIFALIYWILVSIIELIVKGIRYLFRKKRVTPDSAETCRSFTMGGQQTK